MAMSNSEKQAAFKQRKEQAIIDLTTLSTKLANENTTLQKKLDAAMRKIHAMEIELLKLRK
jgi:hypothetical protein